MKKLILKKICLESKPISLISLTISMGESFQDYSWIQDFEADFP